jgi:hypothetical protein
MYKNNIFLLARLLIKFGQFRYMIIQHLNCGKLIIKTYRTEKIALGTVGKLVRKLVNFSIQNLHGKFSSIYRFTYNTLTWALSTAVFFLYTHRRRPRVSKFI